MNKINKYYICLFFLFFIQIQIFSGVKQSKHDSIPVIYTPGYNISVLGIENFHPFDSKKYRKVYKGLKKTQGLKSYQLYRPQVVTDNKLLTVHTPEYLSSLKHSRVIARIVEIPALRILPRFILRRGILKPMKLATGGTILGAKLALQYGWAINLSGGYHHSKSNNGEGFCVFADVPIAVKSLWENNSKLKILIVDLDAHQGNGNSMILGSDSRVSIFDMYNSSIYPNDLDAASRVKYRVQLGQHKSTSKYLDVLRDSLPKAIKETSPGLLIYNAGTDIFKEDPLGGLSVTEEGIIKRDEFVFEQAIENNIPVLMVLSGGYHKKSGYIIAKSIDNLMKKFKLITALEKE